MQANSEMSVLHLTNDRPNCSGLLLLSTFFVSLLGLLYEVRHLSLSVGQNITVNVFIQRLQTFFFIFVTFLTFLKVFFILGGRFFHLCQTTYNISP